MATKTAVHNENAPDFRSMFNWGLKITDYSELFLLAGDSIETPSVMAVEIASFADIFSPVGRVSGQHRRELRLPVFALHRPQTGQPDNLPGCLKPDDLRV